MMTLKSTRSGGAARPLNSGDRPACPGSHPSLQPLQGLAKSVCNTHTHTHLAITGANPGAQRVASVSIPGSALKLAGWLARRHDHRSPSIVCIRIALESVSANGLTWDLRRAPAVSCQREVSSKRRAAALPSTALADKTYAQFWLTSTDQT